MKTRKLICILLSVSLILGLSGSVFAVALESVSIGPIETVEGIVEPKVFSNATLDDDFADNRVMVVLNNAASLKLKTYTAADFPEIGCASVNDLSTATAARVSAKLRGENVAEVFGAKSESVVFSDFYEVDTTTYNQILCLTLPTAGKQNVLEAIKLLMQRDDVKYAGPDFAMELMKIPNDSKYTNQVINMNKLNISNAWDINTGSPSVYVGVIDTGIDGSHEDLRNQINVSMSRDFSQGGCSSVASVTDPDGHGTEVAGIIGAEGDNEIGIAGIAWNITLVSLKVKPSSGTTTYSSYVAAAINYATQQEIPILNCSMGWDIEIEDFYDVHLATAISNYPGLFVCAAGNQGRRIDYYNVYPAGIVLPNLITVGATNLLNDGKRGNSNYSKTLVDIFAPGTDVLTTGTGGRYVLAGDTSIAAPHVAGVAALMLSECPTLTAASIKTKILSNDDNTAELTDYCVSGGRVNAYKALNNAHTYVRIGSYYACTCGDIVLTIP